MNGFRLRKLSALAALAMAAMAPTAALADEGYIYFNDGEGSCGYMVCMGGVCQVVLRLPCPREVGTD